MSGKIDELLQQGHQARRESRQADARRDFIAAVELGRVSADPSDLARALTGLGQIERDMGNAGAALRHYEEAAKLYRGEGDQLRLAHTARHIGDIHQEEGHPNLAAPFYDEAMAIYRSQETAPLELANAIRSVAIHRQGEGQAAEAKLLWQEARDLYAAAGIEVAVAECTRRLAQLAQDGK